MATSLDATVGASTSNSYVTRANADAYFENHSKHATWDAVDSFDKDRYLMQSTTEIDMENIDGIKNDTTTTAGVPNQALKFPRNVDVDSGTEFIPVAVKIATYEQALALAIAGGSSARRDMQQENVKRVRVGDVEEEYELGKGGGSELSSKARQVLIGSGLICMSAGISV